MLGDEIAILLMLLIMMESFSESEALRITRQNLFAPCLGHDIMLMMKHKNVP